MSQETRERIIEACERVIARGGLRGFRMGDVAREAGVSIGLLSYHFGDRDGLLRAALDHVNESAARRAALRSGAVAPDVPRESRPPGEQLAALLCSEFGDDPQVRAGSTAWNELRAAAVFEPDRAAALTRATADWQAEVRRLVAEARADAGTEAGTGAEPASFPAEPDTAALILTSLVEGLSGRWLTGQLTTGAAQRAVRDTLRALGL